MRQRRRPCPRLERPDRELPVYEKRSKKNPGTGWADILSDEFPHSFPGGLSVLYHIHGMAVPGAIIIWSAEHRDDECLIRYSSSECQSVYFPAGNDAGRVRVKSPLEIPRRAINTATPRSFLSGRCPSCAFSANTDAVRISVRIQRVIAEIKSLFCFDFMLHFAFTTVNGWYSMGWLII